VNRKRLPHKKGADRSAPEIEVLLYLIFYCKWVKY